jgi:hypothetical protein
MVTGVTVASKGLLEGIHHLGADQVLGWDHVVQVEPERLFENIPLRLPILLRNRNELIVKLGVNLRSETSLVRALSLRSESSTSSARSGGRL